MIRTAILGNQRKLPYQMPVVSENQIIDQNRAGSSRSDQYANRFGKSYKCSRKSEASSPELIWSVPDMFLCLDSLGATVAKDSAPYDRIGYSESSFDRVSVMHILSHFWIQFHRFIFFLYFFKTASIGYIIGCWRWCCIRNRGYNE